jgi:drug/metabolite transporter (DMT)-like permease
LAALAWPGLLGTWLAYLRNFYPIRARGTTRASLVPYVLPIVGLGLGIAALGEPAGWRLLLGSVLVAAGSPGTGTRARAPRARRG